MFKFKHLTLSLSLSAVLLAGCAAPVAHQDSGIAAPAQWNGTQAANAAVSRDAASAVDHTWWTYFGDPVLNALITEALANNKNLQIATQRVAAAKADRQVAQSALLPQINATGTAFRGNEGLASYNKTIGIAGADVEASWELDLFGRNRAATAQASALVEVEEANRQAVMVGLQAELARNYFDLRNAEQQIAITERNLETQKTTLQLIQVQLQGALASEFDVQRAGAQVSTTEALIPSLQASADAARNRINVLLGLPPGSKDSALSQSVALKPLDPHILVAAPAAVMAARPDVRAAERRFAASLAAKDVATASLYPDISLTALFGTQSSSLYSATPWGVGAGLVQPILNFGRIEAQIDAADAQQKAAFLSYQQVVLESLEDMENALSVYIHATQRDVSLATSVQQNRKAAELARLQYKAGYIGLLDVLVAERSLLDAESAKTASEFALRIDLATIYAAAGGGWLQ